MDKNNNFGEVSSSLPYRPDIDGLRAVAVSIVVGYHAFPNLVRGGMVGVDIFFVISGFLITGIILKGLASERFTLLDFYVRRVRRIFPALVLVLAACLVGGWFLLYDIEYQPLGSHIAGGAAFISNFMLSNEAGYFDSQSDYKELLHLWSLAVEEQFYLLFPLLLVLCRRSNGARLALVGTLLGASFVLNVWLIGREPTVTYYSPATRFWELMLGALLAHVSTSDAPFFGARPAAREVCSWSGVGLIILALCFINESSAFPGWLALLPTLGALLILAAGPMASFNRHVLSSPRVVFIGLISYPLYLWHWPLLSFLRVLSPDTPGRMSRLLVVGLAVLLAWMTWRLVERPLRHVRSLRPIAVGLCILMACIGGAGLLISHEAGFPTRAANSRNASGHQLLSAAIRQNEQIRKRDFQTRGCDLPASMGIKPGWCESFGAADGQVVVLWGDSHAAAWSPAFYEFARRQPDLRIVRFSVGGCAPLIGTRRIDSIFADAPCGQFGFPERIMEATRALKPVHIFMLARWSLYTSSKIGAQDGDRSPGILGRQLQRTLDALPGEIPVTIFRTAPVIRSDPSRALLRHTAVAIPMHEYVRREKRADAAIDAAMTGRPNVSAFDPKNLFCAEQCDITLNGTVLYANATHLSAQGAMLAADEVSRLLIGAISSPDITAGLAQKP